VNIVHVTDVTGRVVAPEWLARAESVHRQLRAALPAGYAAKMQRVFAGGGRMLVAAEGDTVRGVAVWRVAENTFENLHLYVDDLVTDERARSKGVGRLMLDECERLARELGCENLALDSGTQRQRAHKFYFRAGMTITSFHFRKPLA
jgi:GNAT superfamily N-acetyltransferase